MTSGPATEDNATAPSLRDWRFRLVIVALCTAILLSGLDLVRATRDISSFLCLTPLSTDLDLHGTAYHCQRPSWREVVCLGFGGLYFRRNRRFAPLGSSLEHLWSSRHVAWLPFILHRRICRFCDGSFDGCIDCRTRFVHPSSHLDMALTGHHAALQGIGNGGIQSLVSIVVSDLVGLRERGLYNGFVAA
jgi:hypothetical protein